MCDVGMIEGREYFRFALEPREPLGSRANASLAESSAPRHDPASCRGRCTSPMPPAPILAMIS